MNMEFIGCCGVDCSACGDFHTGKCPGCRKSVWEEGDECLPVACCKQKDIACCGQCPAFPCERMAGFYQESEGHRQAYQRMKQIFPK